MCVAEMETLSPPFFPQKPESARTREEPHQVSTAEAQTQGPRQVGGDAQREVESLLADNIKGLFLPEELAKGVDLLQD